MLSEIDNIHRFRNAGSLAAYCGLVPKERSSGDKNYKGALRSECNQFLRWAMIQAVLPAVIKDRGLRQYYQNIKEQKNSSAACIATARLVLKAIYCVLKEQRPYRPQAVDRV